MCPPHASSELEPPIKVLLLITRLTVGGDTNVVLDLARRFRPPAHITADLAAGPVPPHEIDLTALPHAEGIATTIVPTLVNRANPLANARAVMDLRALIRRGRYDIVHTHSSVAGVLGRVAAAGAGVPVIVHHVHGWGVQDGMSPALKAAYLAAERLCARFTDRLIAVSRPTIEKGVAWRICAEERFALIYNGIPLEKFRQAIDERAVRCDLGLAEDSTLVGMVGRLDAQKNPLDFIRAAALVASAHPSAQFVIVGEGNLRRDCEALIDRLGLRRRCLLLGFRPDVERILPLFSVMALSSMWEGLPVVFQEAMSAAVPVVANDVDGARDVVIDGETGYLVRPRDPEAMAARIGDLLRDEDARRRMGRAARQRSNTFSRERMLAQIELLYLELAAAARRRRQPFAGPLLSARRGGSSIHETRTA